MGFIPYMNAEYPVYEYFPIHERKLSLDGSTVLLF